MLFSNIDFILNLGISWYIYQIWFLDILPPCLFTYHSLNLQKRQGKCVKLRTEILSTFWYYLLFALFSNWYIYGIIWIWDLLGSFLLTLALFSPFEISMVLFESETLLALFYLPWICFSFDISIILFVPVIFIPIFYLPWFFQSSWPFPVTFFLFSILYIYSIICSWDLLG